MYIFRKRLLVARSMKAADAVWEIDSEARNMAFCGQAAANYAGTEKTAGWIPACRVCYVGAVLLGRVSLYAANGSSDARMCLAA